MKVILQEVSYRLRTLLKIPGFVGVAIVTVAPGVSANIKVWSWIDSTLWNPFWSR